MGANALGFSTGCKVSTSAETGERVTKEASGGKWKESYIKSFSEQITADGVVLTDGTDEVPSYDQLKDAMLKGEPWRLHTTSVRATSAQASPLVATRASILSPPLTSTHRQETMRNTR